MVAVEAYDHQYIPFEDIVKLVSPERSLAMSPVYQVTFAVQNSPWSRLRLRGLDIEPWGEDVGMKVRCDLEVQAWYDGGIVGMRWLYSRELFDPWRIEQMAKHFINLLWDVVEDSTKALRDIDILGRDDRQNILDNWSHIDGVDE